MSHAERNRGADVDRHEHQEQLESEHTAEKIKEPRQAIFHNDAERAHYLERSEHYRRRVGGVPRRCWCTWQESGGPGKELGRPLQRDPPLISRLYAAYAAKREVQGEAQLARELRQ